jgi:hypothetical protein
MDNKSDTYNGKQTIPAPLVSEVDFDTAWHEFNKLTDDLDTQFAETDLHPILTSNKLD